SAKLLVRLFVISSSLKFAIWAINAVSSIGFIGSCDASCVVRSLKKSSWSRVFFWTRSSGGLYPAKVAAELVIASVGMLGCFLLILVSVERVLYSTAPH